ncbi:MAG: 50S ribosomal protein L5 [Acidobacteriota bacterium]|nr:50S ribosomal protein L5 [Acidobacteriota bacterium]MDH3785526.1 50S ribosomal protein L5 [Acidobacteriota bacterium]
MARLIEKYAEDVAPALKSQFGYSSSMAIPKIAKVVINMGVGDAIQDSKLLDQAVDELSTIAGQRPAVTKARKSISNFKLREGMPIGCRVTLRGTRMYEFLDRLLNLALPRVRDFRGVSSRAFDGRGNYTLGVRDHLMFPEIDYNKVQKVKGMNICIVTTANTDEEARALLAGLGMPFIKKN